MARVASDQRKRLKGNHAYWAAMQARASGFTISDIVGASQGDRATVASYMRNLAKAGFLTVIDARPLPQGGSPAKVYKIVRQSFYAPKVRRDGSTVPEGANDHMWRTMKMLLSFRPDELADAASTDEVIVPVGTAQDYCKHLKAAGYIVEIKPSSNRGGRATYRFQKTKNTGPLAPEIQRIKQVFDPNLGKVMHREEPDNG